MSDKVPESGDILDKVRLAYALALVGPVDMEDSNQAYLEYAEEVLRAYPSEDDGDLARFRQSVGLS